ncbi:LysR family transcriptional regulator [Paraburkholderia sp. BL21I4N1]|uniref:LysR family transcriptional regulator n=1 Tax=Paraburkholderia sp. BL21I4N1 TaxID=1938801 RepID=UPI000CFB8525|nr:LysR family transcriptional regulator [Paraburkholderia sp. BL21I4N1]PQV44474.1 DNA-binding transcriptional LysR family regulator [Paraburkholderia sp. BL21I4N1]
MDLVGLQTFEMVARMGTIAKAAEVLHCAPSNITSRIRKLEHDLGVMLFHRHSRGMHLAYDGRTLLPYARQLVQLVADARGALEGGGSISGCVRLGAMETTAAFHLPTVLRAYRDHLPNVQLELSTGPTAALIDDVLNFQLDGAFVAGPVGHPGLNEDLLAEEELVLIASNRYADMDSLFHAHAHPTLLVYRAGCQYRQRLEAFLYSKGVTGVRAIVLGTMEGILGCVQADLGVSVSTRSAIQNISRTYKISIHSLEPSFSSIQTVFVTPKLIRESRAMSEFRRCLTSEYCGAASLGRPEECRNQDDSRKTAMGMDV